MEWIRHTMSWLSQKNPVDLGFDSEYFRPAGFNPGKSKVIRTAGIPLGQCFFFEKPGSFVQIANFRKETLRIFGPGSVFPGLTHP